MSETIQNMLELGQKKLQNSDTAHLDTEILLAHTLSVDRAHLFAHPEQVLSTDEIRDFKNLLIRRENGEPIAYILGYKEFWSLDLEVTPDVLIPRPETELLVELTLSLFSQNAKIRIADLGVGSGAVAIAIARERPHWQVYGTEQSLSALEVAKRNVDKYQLKNVTLVATNWCEGLTPNSFHAIVSNPPYIAKGDPYWQDLGYEPHEALVAGSDGLDAIRTIVLQAKEYLVCDGWLLLEHGYDQGDEIIRLLQSQGYINIKDNKDLAGKPRVIRGRYCSPKV